MLVINNEDQAYDLYLIAKRIPSTTKKTKIARNTKISLDGPLDVNLFGSRIILGIKENGGSVIVKIISNGEGDIIQILSPSSKEFLVDGVLEKITMNEADSYTLKAYRPQNDFYCFIMSFYPAILARLPVM